MAKSLLLKEKNRKKYLQSTLFVSIVQFVGKSGFLWGIAHFAKDGQYAFTF
jgi:hypothetical protein